MAEPGCATPVLGNCPDGGLGGLLTGVTPGIANSRAGGAPSSSGTQCHAGDENKPNPGTGTDTPSGETSTNQGEGNKPGAGATGGSIPEADSTKLQNILKGLYRGAGQEGRVGDGTTADAIRHERETGESVGGKNHLIKGEENIRALANFLRDNPNASERDKQEAQKQLDNLRDAMGEK